MKLTYIAAIVVLSGCAATPSLESSEEGGPSSPPEGGSAGAAMEGGGGEMATSSGGADPEPQAYAPCEAGACWRAPSVTATCGQISIDEDFSTGMYNVHQREVFAQGGVPVEIALERSAGGWDPALVVHDETGMTIHDGELSSSDGALQVELISTGRDSSSAAVRITPQDATQLSVFATGWSVVESGFVDAMVTDSAYHLDLSTGCEPPGPGVLLSPPNFDPNGVSGGFFLLPQSDPPGLYTRKADDCSRGNKLLIDVLYTVATHWQEVRPDLAPISILDLNEGSCSTVNHATHDDGTHVDLVAGCATEVSCQDNTAAVELAKLFVDTGVACGILNNDTAVQAEVNAYFEANASYEPWHGQFMRSVSGHTHHFHVRVKKPNGLCN